MKETSYLRIFLIAIAASAFTDFVGFVVSSYMEKHYPKNGFMLNSSKSSKSVETTDSNLSRDTLRTSRPSPLSRQLCSDSSVRFSDNPTREKETLGNSVLKSPQTKDFSNTKDSILCSDFHSK